MAYLYPYLRFNGNAREALEFYKDCLNGELKIQTVGETPAAAGMPPETHNSVIHAELRAGDVTLMASDMFNPAESISGAAIALCLVCSSPEEVKDLYNKFLRDAQSSGPLKEEFFGTFGDVTDKFGMRWMFQYSATPPM